MMIDDFFVQKEAKNALWAKEVPKAGDFIIGFNSKTIHFFYIFCLIITWMLDF